MSAMPASAKTSASPSFAQQTPTAPRSICQRATMGDLCVFACGRKRMPAADARSCTRSMLRIARARSMRTCGVGRSARCIARIVVTAFHEITKKHEETKHFLYKRGFLFFVDFRIFVMIRLSTLDGSSLALREHAWESRRADRVSGKDRRGICDAEVPHDDLAEDIAEIGRHREVAPLVPLLD